MKSWFPLLYVQVMCDALKMYVQVMCDALTMYVQVMCAALTMYLQVMCATLTMYVQVICVALTIFLIYWDLKTINSKLQQPPEVKKTNKQETETITTNYHKVVSRAGEKAGRSRDLLLLQRI